MQRACEIIHNSHNLDYNKVFASNSRTANGDCSDIIVYNSLTLKYVTRFYLKDFRPVRLQFIQPSQLLLTLSSLNREDASTTQSYVIFIIHSTKLLFLKMMNL
jgi:hypothetical protein